MDYACSIALFSLVFAVSAAYGVRLALRGRAVHARVEKEGKSALVGKGAMEGFYWLVDPLAGGLARVGISANAITWLSLVFGLAAAVAFSDRHFGLGAAFGLGGVACDVLDGLVARRTGTASDRGEVLDAAIDRWVDFALTAGIGIAFREDLVVLVLAFAASAAAYMVSYSTAKAEALRVTPPRGSMKRTERMIIVLVSAALAPIAEHFAAGWSRFVLGGALAVIAVFGNASAIGRFAAIRAELREKERGRDEVASGATDP